MAQTIFIRLETQDKGAKGKRDRKLLKGINRYKKRHALSSNAQIIRTALTELTEGGK